MSDYHNNDERDHRGSNNSQNGNNGHSGLLIFLMVTLITLMIMGIVECVSKNSTTTEITYNEFLSMLAEHTRRLTAHRMARKKP